MYGSSIIIKVFSKASAVAFSQLLGARAQHLFSRVRTTRLCTPRRLPPRQRSSAFCAAYRVYCGCIQRNARHSSIEGAHKGNAHYHFLAHIHATGTPSE